MEAATAPGSLVPPRLAIFDSSFLNPMYAIFASLLLPPDLPTALSLPALHRQHRAHDLAAHLHGTFVCHGFLLCVRATKRDVAGQCGRRVSEGGRRSSWIGSCRAYGMGLSIQSGTRMG